MSTSTQVNLPAGQWVSLGQGPLTVDMTAGSGTGVYLEVSAAAPTSTPAVPFYTTKLIASQNTIWAMSTIAATIWVTQGASGDGSFAAVTPMIIGTTYSPGRALAVNATAEGSVTFVTAGGSTCTRPVGIGYSEFAYAVTQVVSTTATATFENLS